MSQQKILVVEDDLDSASILEAYLHKDGFQVSKAHDGAQALQLHAQWRPDLPYWTSCCPRSVVPTCSPLFAVLATRR